MEIGDGNTQPDNQPEIDSIWASNQYITTYGQQFAHQVSVKFSIDPVKRIKPIWIMPSSTIPRKLIIDEKNKTILEAKANKSNLKLWYDGFKLDNGGTGATVVWEKNGAKKEWQKQKVGLALNKRIFDPEMWSISKAFKVAEQITCQIL